MGEWNGVGETFNMTDKYHAWDGGGWVGWGRFVKVSCHPWEPDKVLLPLSIMC